MSYPNQSRDVDVREGYFEPETTVDVTDEFDHMDDELLRVTISDLQAEAAARNEDIAKIAKLLGCAPDYISIDLAISVLIGHSSKIAQLEERENEAMRIMRNTSYYFSNHRHYERGEKAYQGVQDFLAKGDALEVKTNG